MLTFYAPPYAQEKQDMIGVVVDVFLDLIQADDFCNAAGGGYFKTK